MQNIIAIIWDFDKTTASMWICNKVLEFAERILNFIKSGEIAIPEIQRPFVWKPRQVGDLIDPLYTGYPTGYLIISQSPNMKLKDGTLSEGKK